MQELLYVRFQSTCRDRTGVPAFEVHYLPVFSVYLQATPQTCLERIKQRARKEEAGVPLVSTFCSKSSTTVCKNSCVQGSIIATLKKMAELDKRHDIVCSSYTDS